MNEIRILAKLQYYYCDRTYPNRVKWYNSLQEGTLLNIQIYFEQKLHILDI